MSPDVQEALTKGVFYTCPCCEQKVKRYPRRLHKTLWRALQYITRCGEAGANAWDIMKACNSTDYSKLALWELTEKVGLAQWKVTEKGKAFLRGEVTIPKFVFTYNNTILGHSEEQMTVKDCHKLFDKEELFYAQPSMLAA